MKMKLWPVVFFILLGLAPAALAQSPLPTPIPAATPVSTATPLSVLIVTPVVTPAPPSAWPAEVEKAIAFVGSLWRTFGWWVILILLGAGLFALARLVGKELFTTWSKQMAAWLDDRRKNLLASLRRGPGPAERALLDDIFDRYEYLEMKGFVREKVMTASLESIYVPLFTRAGEQSGPFRRGGELPGLVVREQSGEPTPLASLLPRHRCLTIIGEAGAGKSTFLRYLALTLAHAWRHRRPALLRQRLEWQPSPLPLPIFLPLSGFGLYLTELNDAEKESPNPELLLGYMRHHFRDLPLPETFFESQLNRPGGCLVLLDGLDEVAYLADRVLISQTITLLSRRYQSSRFIVTCRPEGYEVEAQLGGDFQRADIEPLRWPNDIAAFARCWHQAVLATSERAAEDNVDDFLHRLENQPRVRDLANNPLLLTVMIIVHFNVGQLPERRADLYDSATELLLGWDTRWRRRLVAPPPWLDEIKAAGKRLYLEELAYHWQQQGVLEMPQAEAEKFLTPLFLTGAGQEKEREAGQHAAKFVEWVVERSYLLRPLGHHLAFYRRAFQEYLAARRLAREPDPPAAALSALAGKWDWWEETILLAAGHLSASDPTRTEALLRALLAAPDDPQAPHRHLTLAARALAEAAREHLPWQLADEVKTRLEKALEQPAPAFGVPLRVHAGRALAALSDPRPGVCHRFPLLVDIPAGPFLMGSPPEEVERWKAWYRREIDEGRETLPEDWTKDQLFEVYAAWLDAEAGVFEINVPAFYMARCPVTNAQFAPFVDEETGGYNDPGLWTEAGWAWRQGEGEGWGRPPERRGEPMFWRDSRFNLPNQPVVGITWFEAAAYARWLTRCLAAADCALQLWRNGRLEPLDPAGLAFRLPTEAEWEKAARGSLPSPGGGEAGDEGDGLPSPAGRGAGGEGRIWPWGNDWDAANANTAEERGDWYTTPVGLYPAGASPYGVLDLAGNVWEWTSTRWGDDWRKSAYGPPYRPGDGREDPSGTMLRVIRGGSWGGDRVVARCAGRDRSFPGSWSDGLAMRLVLAPVRSVF